MHSGQNHNKLFGLDPIKFSNFGYFKKAHSMYSYPSNHLLIGLLMGAQLIISSFLKVSKTDLNEAFTCLHSCDLQAIRVWYKTEIRAPKIWHGLHRYSTTIYTHNKVCMYAAVAHSNLHILGIPLFFSLIYNGISYCNWISYFKIHHSLTQLSWLKQESGSTHF